MAEHRRRIKLVIERTEDGYIAYPLGIKGIVVAQGESYEEALHQVQSAVQFHLETFGDEALEEAAKAEEVFVAETEVAVG